MQEAQRRRHEAAQPPLQRVDEETAISHQTIMGGPPQTERRETFAGTIDEALRLGWSGHFSAAYSVLVALKDTRATSPGQRALCRALLALVCAGNDDVSAARRLARQAISDSARPAASVAPAELCWLRLARALAANAGHLVGDVVRARRAAQARFMANDPDSAWLIGWRIEPPWQEAPIAVQRYARFVATVHTRYKGRRSGPLTPAEIAIFRHVATGANAVEIARLLERSPHTVRTHLRNAYVKLHAHGRDDALSKVRGLGLLNRAAGCDENHR